MSLGKRVTAELVGTLWLVLGGCGSAVLAAAFPDLGIGFAGVALAFGLTVLTMAYAVGHISGAHFNPAVTFGLWAGGRFKGSDVFAYILAQVVGAIAGAGYSTPSRPATPPSAWRAASPRMATAPIRLAGTHWLPASYARS